MSEIIIKNIECYGYHGVCDFERKDGQKFFFDISLFGDFKKAGISDDLEDTVNYAQVFELVVDICENCTFNLIEALAEKICSEILKKFELIEGVNVVVRKPYAPISGKFDYVAVKWEKKRND